MVVVAPRAEWMDVLSKIIWSCSHCGTVLPLWMMKCSNCKRLALSWLHLIVPIAVAVPLLVLLFKYMGGSKILDRRYLYRRKWKTRKSSKTNRAVAREP